MSQKLTFQFPAGFPSRETYPPVIPQGIPKGTWDAPFGETPTYAEESPAGFPPSPLLPLPKKARPTRAFFPVVGKFLI